MTTLGIAHERAAIVDFLEDLGSGSFHVHFYEKPEPARPLRRTKHSSPLRLASDSKKVRVVRTVVPLVSFLEDLQEPGNTRLPP